MDRQTEEPQMAAEGRNSGNSKRQPHFLRFSAAICGFSLLFGLALLSSPLPAQRTDSARLTWDGLERTFTVHIPRTPDSTRAMPLVIVLHGRGGSGPRVMRWSGFEAKAEAEGFLLVAPEGTGEPRGWYTGFSPGGAIDDVGFVGALIDTVSASYRVDRTRVYVAGHSNGGVLAHRIAADLSSRIAAVAVVAGAVGARSAGGNIARINAPRGPVPVLIMHGDADGVVPYDTGRPMPAPDGARFWARANECAVIQPRRDTLATGRVLRDTWDTRCRAPVVFLTVRGGDHGWPRTSRGAAIDATDVIWEFFAQHRR
jgi:polyhydroxybutyrate depolymerase